jgi:hypothetical protein
MSATENSTDDLFENEDLYSSGGLWAINRLLTTHALRYIVNLTEIFDNDIVLAIICLTIGSANVAHIDQSRLSDVSIDDITPDDMRRPVSILAVAQSLKLPYETTRRYVRKLQAMGICEAKKGGVIIPYRMLKGEQSKQVMVNNANNFRRLVRDLKKLGVQLD